MAAPIEEDHRWLLPIDGYVVTQCRLDYTFTMVATEGAASVCELQIEQPFTVGAGSLVTPVNPEGDPTQMAPALRILRAEIAQACAYKDGCLSVAFVDGTNLRVPPCESAESWNVVGPAGLRIVSLPGGDLALWPPDHQNDNG